MSHLLLALPSLLENEKPIFQIRLEDLPLVEVLSTVYLLPQ